jgi:dUTP pyrophosphatase
VICWRELFIIYVKIILLKLKILKLNSDAIIPSYAHPGDVGMDVYSMEDYVLKPGERRIFFLGFAMEFPTGHAAIIKDKGSLPKNGGVHTMGGVYDAGYRGEYNVNLINLGAEEFNIVKGHKIAQIVIVPVVIAKPVEVLKLSDTSRGQGRFGSTGK